MGEIKNIQIAVALAAIYVAFNDATVPDSVKEKLTEAMNTLQAFDGQLDIEQTAAKDQAAQAAEVINELKEQLAASIESKAQVSTKPVVEVDGEKYQVNHTPYGFASPEAFRSNEAALRDVLKKDGQTCLTKL